MALKTNKIEKLDLIRGNKDFYFGLDLELI